MPALIDGRSLTKLASGCAPVHLADDYRESITGPQARAAICKRGSRRVQDRCRTIFCNALRP